MDMKGFLTKKNIIIMAAAALAVALVVTLIILLGGLEPKERKNTDVTYEEYQYEMTEQERLDHYYSFENYEDFFDWYNAAKDAYYGENDDPVLGDDGVIDLGGSK